MSYSEADKMLQYELHVLSLLDVHVAAVCHAKDSVLQQLNRLQITITHALCMNEGTAFLFHNLTSLSLRRDLARLGFLHKCTAREAHPFMRKLLPPLSSCSCPPGRHDKQLNLHAH